MNSKNRIYELLAITAMSAGSLAFLNEAKAQGHETTGGAQVVRRANELRDFMESQCTIQGGDELIASMPELRARIAELKQVHWYLGFSLEREISRMNFCFTGGQFNPNQLPKVEDPRGIILTIAPESTEFLAIRVIETREAYVRTELYNPLSPLSKAMTIIHEALHSFIDLNVADRSFRLRSFTNTLRNLNAAAPGAKTKLEKSIEMNRIHFASRSSVRKNTALLEFALGTDDQQRSAILDGRVTLRQILNSAWLGSGEALTDEDEFFLRNNLGDEANRYLGRYCDDRDEAVLNILRAQIVSNFDLDEFCASRPAAIEDLTTAPDAQTLAAIERRLEGLYRSLIQATAVWKNGRIQFSGSIRMITANGGNPKNMIPSLQAIPIRTLSGAEGETKLWLGIITNLAKNYDVAQWLNIVRAGGLLQKALDPSSLVAQINALPATTSIDRDEKAAAADYLKVLFREFKSQVTHELNRQNLTDHAIAWSSIFTP